MKRRSFGRPFESLSWVWVLGLFGLQFAFGLQDRGAEPTGFLEQVKDLARGNFFLDPDDRSLRQYTWTCSVERLRLDRKGTVKGRERVSLLEAFVDEGRLVVRIRLFDEGGFVVERSPGAVISVFDPDAPELQQLRDAQWELAKFDFVGRDDLDGRETLVYSFRTPERAPDDGSLEKWLESSRKAILKSQGRMWIDRQDRKLVQIEGEYYGTVTLARGGFASGVEITRGTRWSWRLAKNELGDWLPRWKKRTVPRFAWLPSRRGSFQTVHSYSDFKKLP